MRKFDIQGILAILLMVVLYAGITATMLTDNLMYACTGILIIMGGFPMVALMKQH